MEAKSITTQPSNSPPPSQRGIETLPPLDAAFLLVISLVIPSVVLAALIYAYIPKRWQYSFSFKLRNKVPCGHCQYFSGNPHLKCALHPVAVLTEQAVDCTDYCLNRKAKQIKE